MLLNTLKRLEYFQVLDQLSTHAITELGQEICHTLQPSFTYESVLRHIKETAEGVFLMGAKRKPSFLPISNTSYIFKQLESNTTLSAKSLLEMNKLLLLAAELEHYYLTDNETPEISFPYLHDYFSTLYTNPSIHKSIAEAILDENTIADEASKELAHIRKQKRRLEESIKEKLDHFIHSNTYAKYLQESIITIRNDRYVIPVKEEYRNQIQGFIHDTSASGSTLFIEPMSIFTLNNECNVLKIAEVQEIENILATLSSLLFPITNQLKTNLTILGTLDFIFAKASYAISMQATEPLLNTTHYIELKGARHPFIPSNQVVPIDVELGKKYSTLVITGPNTGGKTVTLKTVGLLTLMALSGLYIPAKESSSIYVFDHIFADMGDEQSIQESLSTFSSHMSNIIEILKEATSNSLILLDELGSGTDPIEGSSLAISILEEFHKRKTLTFSTTHYPEIKNYTLVTEGFENASVEFDIEKLQPTYRLLTGIPGKSNAFAISKKLGLSSSLLERASDFIDTETINIEELLKNIYDTKLQIEKEKEETQKNLNQIEELRKTLDQKNTQVKQKELDIIAKAKEQARNILLEAKQEASSIIKEMNELSDTNSIKEVNNLRNKLTKDIKDLSSTNPISSTTPSSLTTGDITLGMTVFVNTLNQIGTILSLPTRSKQVQVQVGSAKLSLPLSILTKTNQTPTKTTNFQSGFKTNKAKFATTEINVLGTTVEEAIFLIDKFLDDASLSKLTTIRIVHGKGTGALRKGIHQFLKTHAHVQSYRLGTYGEGEMGVTVVELK